MGGRVRRAYLVSDSSEYLPPRRIDRHASLVLGQESKIVLDGMAWGVKGGVEEGVLSLKGG